MKFKWQCKGPELATAILRKNGNGRYPLIDFLQRNNDMDSVVVAHRLTQERLEMRMQKQTFLCTASGFRQGRPRQVKRRKNDLFNR